MGSVMQDKYWEEGLRGKIERKFWSLWKKKEVWETWQLNSVNLETEKKAIMGMY